MTLTGEQRAALAGIGDRQLREAQDALGVSMLGSGDWCAGDEVSFVLPDTVRRNGTIERFSDGDAVVRIERGACAVVPIAMLEPPSEDLKDYERQAKVREAMRLGALDLDILSHKEVEPGLHEASLSWKRSRQPSEADITDVLSARFDVKARLIDGEQYPGGARVRFRVESAMEPPDPNIKERSPGLVSEALPGDGGTEPSDPTLMAATAQIKSLEAMHPDLRFICSGLEQEEGRTTIRFTPVHGNTALRVNRGLRLTASKAHSVQADGRVVADGFGVRVFMASPHGDVTWTALRKGSFDDIQSPLTPEFDRGKADDKTPALALDTSYPEWDDQEHIGGPGLNVAEKQASRGPIERKYWSKLYKHDPDFVEHLLRDIPKRKSAEEVVAALVEAFQLQGRFVSPKYAARVIELVASAPEGLTKRAQGENLADALLYARGSNPKMAQHVDRLLVDYLAAYPEGIQRAGKNAYEQVFRDAVAYFERADPKKLEAVRQRAAPEAPPVDTNQSRGLWQRVKETVSPVEREMSKVQNLPYVAPQTMAPNPKRPAPKSEPFETPEQAQQYLGIEPNEPAQQLLPRRRPVPREPWSMPGPTPRGAAAAEKSDMRPMPPALGDAGFRLDPMNIHARGNYLFARIDWDPDRLKGVSDGNLKQWLRTFLEGCASSTRVMRLGFIAGIRIHSINVEKGQAVLMFQSSEWKNFPQEVVTSEI